jgi:adenine-specific DNA-methyltransferase
MAIKYVPYYPDTLEGQALLDNFVRTKRMLRYHDNGKVVEHIRRGMPCYEVESVEHVGANAGGNLVIHGECLPACAYLKDKGIQVDLVYIDPPFASGANYAKKVYLRRNPKAAEALRQAEKELDFDELRAFEENMYGDIWNKESYLNWMYENLMAIKSVMSETASIYVHLDWHIGHYVKILLDEIFGEDNFRNEIIWHYRTGNLSFNNFQRKHDTIFFYVKNDEAYFEQQHVKEYYVQIYGPNKKLAMKGPNDGKDEYGEYKISQMDDVWNVSSVFTLSNEHQAYATQKPEALLERIIKASSKEGMVVADFFGGSGVTAAVSNRLGRKFIHVDINLNSIQTTRDRLVAAKAGFGILEVKDGLSLFRNPVQTMERLGTLIQGFCNDNPFGKPWAGSIVNSEYGTMPVFLPDLKDSHSRVLDKPMINHIVKEALPDLPEDTQRVVVYYVDVEDIDEIKRFIDEQNNTLVKVELRDLKQVLDEVVADDYAEWELSEAHDGLFNGWKVEITLFQSDRVIRKVNELNSKNEQQALSGGKKKFVPVILGDNGLETIEWVSLDCSTAEGTAPWHSDAEVKIDKAGYVLKNGVKTACLWDACVYSEDKPLRMKIRNICGDETVYVL